MKERIVDLKSVFTTLSGSNVLVLPDTPKFTIVAVSPDYLQTTGRSEQDLLGKGLFEAFPNNPDDPHLTSEKTVRASLEYTLRHKEPHHLPVQRYDIAREDGNFEERYWSANNKPVLNEEGEVIYLVHAATDVTKKLKKEQDEERLKGIQKAYDLFMSAPVIIGVLRGDDYVIELANDGLLEVWGRPAEVIGKPLFEAIPELKLQGLTALLERVRATGEAFYANEFPITLNRCGKEEVFYFNFVYKPVYNGSKIGKAGGIISIGHDVTAQVIAKRKEQESEAKYRKLFESMDQGFCVLEMIFDETGKPVNYCFLEINPVFEKQTGLKDALNKTILELVPNIESYWIEQYGKVALTGEAINFVQESKVMGRWYEVNAFRIGENDGRNVALLFTDITARIKADEALRRSEERQSFLLTLSDRLRPLADPAEIQYEAARLLGEHFGANRAGYAEDAGDGETVIVTRNFTNGVPCIEGRYRYDDYGPVLLREFRAGRTVVCNDIAGEATLNSAEKEAYAALQVGSFIIVPLLKNSHLFGLLFMHCTTAHNWSDVEVALVSETAERTWEAVERARAEAALRQSEERLRKVIASETVGVVFFNLDGTIHDTNAAFEHMSGFSKQDLVNGKVRWDQMTPPEFKEVTLRSREEFLTKWQNTPYEKQHIRPDGSRWWGLFAGKRLSENECVEFVVDITATKDVEAELEKKVKERTSDLEKRNKDLEQFTHVSHHDLQEPLRKISMFTDMVKAEAAEKLSEAAQLRLSKVADAAKRMSAALRDVLDYASLNQEEQFVEVDLDETLAVVQTDLELMIQEKKAKISSDALPIINAVPGQMHRLFYNLVNNALKFSKAGEVPDISISCKRLTASEAAEHPELNHSKSYYEIVVQDNGIGFHSDAAQKIFGMFQRLHNKDAYAGTGIGLALVKKVATNHGGKVWAESAPGEGATFKILLPAE